MSRFGKHGFRCDGCGIFTPHRNGAYVKPNGDGGSIISWGRNCDHDFCDTCEAKHQAAGWACSKCGAKPA